MHLEPLAESLTVLAAFTGSDSAVDATTHLRGIVVLLAASVFAAALLGRLGQSSILGYLGAGILLGPNALRLVAADAQTRILSEVGVVLLLFTIGIEFSPERLLRLGRSAMLGGILQVAATMAAVVLLTAAGLGFPLRGALVAGAALAMSSTAIVLALLKERGELDTAHGRIALGILIVQDVCVPPLMLILDAAGAPGALLWNVAGALGKAAVLLAGVAFVARFLLPWLLGFAARTESSEVFTLTALTACLGTAWAASALGLSLPLGAFVAGVVLGGSAYSHQIAADVLPFRSLFYSLFFVSIGMLLDLRVVFGGLGDVLLLALAVVLGKALIAATIIRLLRFPIRVAAQAGLEIAQAGEFSFVLLSIGMAEGGGLDRATHQSLLAACVLSMLATPALLTAGPRIAAWAEKLRLGPADREGAVTRRLAPVRRDHVVICGFGPVGETLGRVLESCEIPYVALELSARTVERARATGKPVLYGDATRREVLAAAGAREARVLAVCVPDPIAARAITRTARDLSDRVMILVRTKFVSEVKELYSLGATEVVEEERETALEILARSLRAFAIPKDVVGREIQQIRAAGYAVSDDLGHKPRSLGDVTQVLRGIGAEVLTIAEGSRAAGQALWELDLRRRTGASVLAVLRKGQVTPAPGGDFTLLPGDVVVAAGAPPHLMAIEQEFQAPASGVVPAPKREDGKGKA
ncbi:MAG: cation:proton antiporter [Planctomycetales bacterium]|nr:cation:proton antiporter [Planctomycetales bacterium]